jgi:hypothetical protein
MEHAGDSDAAMQGKDGTVDAADMMGTSAWLDRADPGEIYVDAEGDWYFQGNKIIRPDILEFFCEHLALEGNAEFAIEWRQNRCPLVVADTPLVVIRVDRRLSEHAGEQEILLTLKHLHAQEVLDPSTLTVGKDNVLYCKVRSARFPARFSRPAYYQLAEWMDEDRASGGFYVELNRVRYFIGMRNSSQS